ncbi:MAG: hypothetical protein E7578_06455 [Ruminococcaceae bacterium]|nr:hypothetical protein [Oscillospiraceae bacterium]
MKKVFIFMLLLAIIFSFATAVFAYGLEITIKTDVDPGAPGDPTGDGRINLSDISIIMKYIAKWDISKYTFIEDAADVTHDGKIDLHDVSKILKYLARWHGLIEPPKDTSPITTETAIAT